jgi:hypothetical protein
MFQPVFHFLERFGNVVGRFILSIIYWVAVGPVAIFYRLFTDVLWMRKPPASTWRDWTQVNETLDDARRQD